MQLNNVHDNSTIKLCISIITYNQKKYIAQTIESALMQKTNFVFEIVLGDDYSTDGTRDICIEYANRYPKIIKLRLPDKNLGFIINMRENLLACKGKYIAILEGDDYWIDEYKLQKQVDFLEQHDDCGLVCTEYEVINTESGKKGLSAEFYQTEIINENFPYNFEDLLKHNFVGSTTAVFRNDNLDYSKLLCNDYKTGEYPIWLYLALKYKFYYLSDVTTVYRYIPNSLSHQIDEYKAFKFGATVEAIKYRFAKMASLEQPLTDRYVKLLKYQLELAFEHNDKDFYEDAIVKLNNIAPQIICSTHRIKKKIVSYSYLVLLYKNISCLKKILYKNIKTLWPLY